MTGIWARDLDVGGGFAGWRRGTAIKAPGYLPGWGMPIFEDLFPGNAIDAAKWNVRSRNDLGLTPDAAEPVPSQVFVSNGICTLRGVWKATPEARSTSATGTTELTHDTGYMDHRLINGGDVHITQSRGRWEARIKAPTGPNTLGTLAAFWLRGEGSDMREIDIFEAWGHGGTMASDYNTYIKDTGTVTFYANTSTGAGKVQNRYKDHLSCAVVPHDGFHTYAFELMDDYAALIIDGAQYGYWTPADTPVLWDVDGPLHMRLNLHIGMDGTYWGRPDTNNQGLTQDPLDMQIEHVRVWAA